MVHRHQRLLHRSAVVEEPDVDPEEALDTTATAEDASQYLIRDLSISTVPWDDCGAFLRFSATYEAEDEAAEDDIMAEAHARLMRARLKF